MDWNEDLGAELMISGGGSTSTISQLEVLPKFLRRYLLLNRGADIWLSYFRPLGVQVVLLSLLY